MDSLIDNLSLVGACDINEDLLEFFSDIANKEERQVKILLYLWGKLMDNGR